MRYHDITKDDMKNGDGLRVVLWVAGCEHACPECQNPVTWSLSSGLIFDEAAKAEIFEELDKDYVSGITFSGGDPLHKANRVEVLALMKEIHNKYPDKSIWVYTGYLWEDIENLDGIELADTVVDGKFLKNLKEVNLHWIGSSNQRVIDVKKTMAAGDIVVRNSSL